MNKQRKINKWVIVKINGDQIKYLVRCTDFDIYYLEYTDNLQEATIYHTKYSAEKELNNYFGDAIEHKIACVYKYAGKNKLFLGEALCIGKTTIMLQKPENGWGQSLILETIT
jgi:hypothetical protein